MKKMILTIGVFLLVLTNVNSNVALVNKINSGPTNACADAITSTIRAQNALSQPDWCALWLIMHNTETTSSEKWTAVANLSNLDDFRFAVQACTATLVANNFDDFDSTEMALVRARIKDSLMGAPNVDCNGYYIGCGDILDDDIDCMKAACDIGVSYGWAAFCGAVAVCDARMIHAWYNLCQSYPGCGPIGGTYQPPKSWVWPFDGAPPGCE